mmetsp:Transcript_52172/g.124330  ORF Transcript_52172/g.124330 Transcript_52172/m.124330 type:complete len:448 (+) Transcript_52172:188-1531(+)
MQPKLGQMQIARRSLKQELRDRETQSAFHMAGKATMRYRPQHSKCSAGPKSQVSAVRRASRSELQTEKLLERLYAKLKVLSREMRQEVLQQKFSQAQRLSLEHWLISKRTGKENLPPISNDTEVAPVSRKRGIESAKSGTSGCERPLSAMKTGGLERCLTSRVRRGTQEVVYTVTVSIGCLRLQSKEMRSLEAAKKAHAAMVSIKTCMGSSEANEAATDMAGATCNMASDFEDRFRAAVQTSLHGHGLLAEEIGLRFCMCLPALWLPRPLRTPTFLASGAAMDEGLRVWRRLADARGQVYRRGRILQCTSPEELARSWVRIREAYADIMVEAGHESKTVAMNLDALEQQRAKMEEEQLQRWNCNRMAQEEKAQRKAMACEEAKLRANLHMMEDQQTHMTKEQRSGVSSVATSKDKTLRTLEKLLRRWNPTQEKTKARHTRQLRLLTC